MRTERRRMRTERRCRLTTEPGDFWRSSFSRYMTVKDENSFNPRYVAVDEEGRITNPRVYTMAGPQTVEVELPDRRSGADRRVLELPACVGRRRLPQPLRYSPYDRRANNGRRNGRRRES